MRIGPYTLDPVETGTIRLDGGAMFGTVPRVLWEKKHPPDELNRIELAMRALLIRGEGRTILVDCGAGGKGDEKFRRIYGLDSAAPHLDKSLGGLGLDRTEVTDVILTHLHFDHAGGGTERSPDGTIRPAFPNAVYHLQRRNLETARNPNLRERASYFRENFEALEAGGHLRLIDGPGEFAPGIDLLVSEGHTEAQQLPRISDGATTLLYGGDTIPTAAHIPLPWIAGYDLHPLTLLKEKESILAPAARERWVIFFEHDPRMQGARVFADSKGFAFAEPVDLSGSL